MPLAPPPQHPSTALEPRTGYDPELLSASVSFPPPPVDATSLAAFRARPGTRLADVEPLVAEGDLVHHEVHIPVPGRTLVASVIRPRDAGPDPLPCLLDLHGGGMIAGNRFDSFLPEHLRWAAEHRMALVSPDYALAPEAHAPQAALECFAVLRWVHEHAVDLGVDPQRLLVGGVSAGGGLAASVALQARDAGGPALAGQLLICPMLDDTDDTPSARHFTQERGVVDPWPAEASRFAWSCLLGEDPEAPHAYASAARADDLAGLPPTYLDVGSSEVFRDADLAFAGRLLAAGVATELHVWPGGFHGSDAVVPGATISRRAVRARSEWLSTVLFL